MPGSHRGNTTGGMKTFTDFSLRGFNSFGVEAVARKLVQLDSMQDISQLGATAFNPGTDLVLGGGTNILFTRDVEGTVFLNRMAGKTVFADDGESVLVDIAAGENWHEFVTWSLEQGFCGLENLSLIPGLAGAAPMQNIGAYGVEISELLDSVKVLDWHSGKTANIDARNCGLGYRDSRFKSADPGRFLILSCRLKLRRNAKPVITYAGLAEELAAMNIHNADARQVSEAVIRLRKRKLPDPVTVGNAGSFFKNPVVSAEEAETLRATYPAIPVFNPTDHTLKLSAAWLIEQCGWKGFREDDAGVSARHALVLVNHGKASGKQLLSLSQKISCSVYERFGVRLEREPQLF
jgi:UDP-N-acetylmuramate dehydrogenase